MRFKLFSHVSLRQALTGGTPGIRCPAGMFAAFIPGTHGIAEAGIVGDQDGANLSDRPDYAALQPHYFVWRNLLEQYDFVGFEQAKRPLFIDPMTMGRLRADFPAIASLRERRAANWSTTSLRMTEATAREYAAMRAALTDADRARVALWLGTTDVVVTPPGGYLRQTYLRDRWPAFAQVACRHGVFRQIPEEFMLAEGIGPLFNSFIMRTALFAQFAGSLFPSLFAFEAEFRGLVDANLHLLAERLLGVYLRYLVLVEPMLRIAQTPALHAVPDAAPSALPEGFDPAAYLLMNPDVAAAGIDPGTHFMRHGWQEDRDWRA